MDCTKARFLIYAYLDRDLLRTDAEALNRHLMVCGSCAARSRSARGLLKVLRSRLDYARAPIGLRERLHAGLVTPHIRPRYLPLGLAASILLLLLPLVGGPAGSQERGDGARQPGRDDGALRGGPSLPPDDGHVRLPAVRGASREGHLPDRGSRPRARFLRRQRRDLARDDRRRAPPPRPRSARSSRSKAWPSRSPASCAPAGSATSSPRFETITSTISSHVCSGWRPPRRRGSIWPAALWISGLSTSCIPDR